MSNYIGLLPATYDNEGAGKVYLFECKPWSGIKEGEYVAVEGVVRFARAIADPLTVDRTSGEYIWALKVLGAQHPLKKVVGVFVPVEYKED